ncbi:MAG: efflux RND transporter periplasmic adaptor subunit [Candidatus Competibacterales bacterium]
MALRQSSPFVWLVLPFFLWLFPPAAAVFAQAPPGVLVAEVSRRDVSPSSRYVGRVEATDSVELRARVAGFLEQRNFEEGRTVAAGELLFTIEKAPYQAAVAAAKADVAAAVADRKNARAALARLEQLAPRNLASQADLDAAAAAAAVAEASVLKAEAALEQAQLDLNYTDIKSPIDGRISAATYSVGNLVGPESGTLATVTSIDPIYVTMAISERQLIEARRSGINLDNPPVFPQLVLGDGGVYEPPGNFNYLSPAVDPNTDTLQARAVFPNPQGLLVPGQFVSVIIRRKTPTEATVVPQVAVQQDAQGYFVLVVDRANAVEQRRIQVGGTSGDDWVVEDGLATGERVIVQGAQKVRPGITVAPEPAPIPRGEG